VRDLSRRDLLRAAGATGAAAALAGPAAAFAAGDRARRRARTAQIAARLTERAAAVPAAGSDIGAIEHLVFMVMENRSYDHYFGTYPSGRGFDDHPADSYGVFAQPYPSGTNLDPAKVLLPFYLGGDGCTEDQSHGWGTTHSTWDTGKMDGFATSLPPRTMGYYKGKDVPFHWALADNFTLCDGYHCSVLGPTHPNRLMAVCGTIDPAGQYGGPITATNSGSNFQWTLTCTTIQEVLEDAGISWKYYNPSDLDMPQKFGPLVALPGWNPALYDPSIDTNAIGVGDNILPYFKNFQKTSSPLFQKAFLPTIPGDFYRDVASGQLPSVSWIGPPIGFDEHPDSDPVNGEWMMSMVLAGLTANPEVWAKTALFITYDEAGGFFDHVAPPTAPLGTLGEYITAPNPSPSAARNQWEPATDPIGLGIRVPMMVVSPFSRGGQVVSDVFDHTSHARLIETRFGVQAPNISAWRRQTVGDLTSTLTATPDTSVPNLPATAIYMPLAGPCAETNQITDTGGLAPGPPVKQTMPAQVGSAAVASTGSASTGTTSEGVTAEVLNSGHNGPVRLRLRATGADLRSVEIELLEGRRTVSTKQLRTLGSRSRTVSLHHHGKLRAGRFTIVVRSGGRTLLRVTERIRAASL
jgi:phospholipase C